MSFFKSLFRIKPADFESLPSGLRRCLNAFDLTLLGIGAIIGAGIFVLTGIAAATQAGPSIIVSYILASIACGFCALAYAELAASIGGSGSAYGYLFAGVGEFIAWIIGWDLLLAYSVNAATISVGWSAYANSALVAMGIHIPQSLLTDPFNGGIVNLPALLVVFALASILSIGPKQSSRFNNIIVFIKLAVIALFIGIGFFYFDAEKWKPFVPFGLQGIVNGAGLIFFAYIGFDAVSTAAEETIRPQRDLPIGIIASLAICTIIYVLFAGLLTGMMYYPDLNVSSPATSALLHVGHHFAAGVVAIGAVAGLTTGILAMYYGFTRVYLAMARDGLLPQIFVKVCPKSGSPKQLIWSGGVIIALVAGFFPIAQIANLVNIGALAAFVAVCACVLVLRKTKPDMPRPFKTPFSPVVPILGIVMCGYLMLSLPAITWISFAIWTVLGLFVYFIYGRFNSVVRYLDLAVAKA